MIFHALFVGTALGMGCEHTTFGCCRDGENERENRKGTNCSFNLEECGTSFHGCCQDGTERADDEGSNCGAVGGCGGTEYGCCEDGETFCADEDCSNCLVGGCEGTEHGCCWDDETAKADDEGSNCPDKPDEPVIGGCAGTEHGCCDDGETSKADAEGSNCAAGSSTNWLLILGGFLVAALAAIVAFFPELLGLGGGDAEEEV